MHIKVSTKQRTDGENRRNQPNRNDFLRTAIPRMPKGRRRRVPNAVCTNWGGNDVCGRIYSILEFRSINKNNRISSGAGAPVQCFIHRIISTRPCWFALSISVFFSIYSFSPRFDKHRHKIYCEKSNNCQETSIRTLTWRPDLPACLRWLCHHKHCHLGHKQCEHKIWRKMCTRVLEHKNHSIEATKAWQRAYAVRIHINIGIQTMEKQQRQRPPLPHTHTHTLSLPTHCTTVNMVLRFVLVSQLNIWLHRILSILIMGQLLLRVCIINKFES